MPGGVFDAGGPGSGRKPGWGSSTKNKNVLDNFHNTLTSRGYVYRSSGGKPESGMGRNHTYVNKESGQQKHFVEYADGNHTRWSSKPTKI